MGDAVAIQHVQSAVEIAHPQAARGIELQRGDVAVGQRAGLRASHFLPRRFAVGAGIEDGRGHGEHRAGHVDEALNRAHRLAGGWADQAGHARSQRDGRDTLFQTARQQGLALDGQCRGEESAGEGSIKAAIAELGYTHGSAHVGRSTGRQNRRHIRVRQAFRLAEMRQRTGLPMVHAAIGRAGP